MGVPICQGAMAAGSASAAHVCKVHVNNDRQKMHANLAKVKKSIKFLIAKINT